MEDNSKTSIGFLGLLQLSFIVLKLCDVITWSWFWVLSPLWAELVLVIVLVIVFRR